MSPLPYELALALRYLRPKRTFVSVITLICILGVALGVSVLIIVISVMTGFGLQLRQTLIGFSAHISVEQVAPGAIKDWRPLMDRLATNPAVRGVAPYINTQILIDTQTERGGPQAFGTMARGIDPKLEGRVTELTNKLVAGEFRLTPNSLLVPVEVARQYGLRVGDHVAVYSLPALRRMREAQREKRDEVDTAEDFIIRGILDLGMNDLNKSLVITSLPDAAELWGQDDGVQGLTVMLHDPSDETTVRVTRELEAALGADYVLSNWMRQNRDFLNALATEKSVMFYILFFIVIVAAFGIMSALITFVVQKTREIGMLKALGATPLSVAMLFLTQSVVVGVLGVLSGFALGMLALKYRNEFLYFMNRVAGIDLFPASIYQFTGLPARIVPGDVAIICGVSLVICVLAGVLPALRAARLQPVEALRNE
jgi:lipoprotein-releasing system permease protein